MFCICETFIGQSTSGVLCLVENLSVSAYLWFCASDTYSFCLILSLSALLVYSLYSPFLVSLSLAVSLTFSWSWNALKALLSGLCREKRCINFYLQYNISNLYFNDMTNFLHQLASSTIDASAKIYAGRVDAIHSETYKVLSGLGRGGASHAPKTGGRPWCFCLLVIVVWGCNNIRSFVCGDP